MKDPCGVPKEEGMAEVEGKGSSSSEVISLLWSDRDPEGVARFDEVDAR
jgi:hypothetical protein